MLILDIRVPGKPASVNDYEQDEISIGSGEKCLIFVSGEQVSREHAKITKKQDGYAIELLNGMAKLYINGIQQTAADLEENMWIKLGNCDIKIVKISFEKPQPVVKEVRKPPKKLMPAPKPVESKPDNTRKLFIGIGAGAGALILIVILVSVFSGKNSNRPAPTHKKKKEVVDKPTDTDEKSEFEKLAAKSKNPQGNHAALVREWEQFCEKVSGTPLEADAREQVKALRTDAAESALKAFKELVQKANEAASRMEFDSAVKLLESYPKELDLDNFHVAGIEKEKQSIIELRDFSSAQQKCRDLMSSGLLAEAESLIQLFAESKKPEISGAAKSTLEQIRTTSAVAKFSNLMKKRNEEGTAAETGGEKQGKSAASPAEIRNRIKQNSDKNFVGLKVRGSKGGSEPVKLVDLGDKTAYFKNTKGTETAYDLLVLSDETLLDIEKCKIDKESARDWFDLGKRALQIKMYGAAKSYFKKATDLDSSLQELVPDVEKISRGYVSINGKVSGGGNSARILYPFAESRELDDFTPDPGTTVSVNKGLTLGNEGNARVFGITTKSIRFEKRVKFTAELGNAAKAIHLIGYDVNLDTGDHILIIVVVNAAKGKYSLQELRGGKANVLKEDRTEDDRITKASLELNKDQLNLFFNNKKEFTYTTASFHDVSMFLGGITESEDNQPVTGSVVFTKAEIEGRVPADWLRKLRAEAQDVLDAELSKDRKITKEMLGGKFNDLPEPPDGEMIETLRDEVRPAAREIVDRMNSAMSGTEKSLDSGIVTNAVEFARSNSAFALSHYIAGYANMMADNFPAAMEYFKKAVDLEPAFAESYYATGYSSYIKREYKDAVLAFDNVIRVKPAYVEALAVRALALLEEGRREDALQSIAAAARYRGNIVFLVTMERKIRNLVIGPQWPKEGTYVVEGTFSTVRTNISRARGEFYSKNLDIALKHYSALLGIDSGRLKKVETLVFNTAEGYYTYSDFNTADRMEHTLGVYYPLYNQLLLFEDKDADEEETLQTLFHEGFHNFLDQFIPNVPIWLNEGFAEYVSGMVIDLKQGKVVKANLTLAGRLSNLMWAFEKQVRLPSLRDLMLMSQERFYAENAPLNYAQAWSVVYFLANKYPKLLGQYVGLMMAGRSNPEAVQTVFGDKLPQLEGEWRQFFKK